MVEIAHDLLVLLFIAIFVSNVVADSNNEDVAAAMKECGIVPDVIDIAPKEFIQIRYGHLSVNLGNELTPTQVKDIPKVDWEAEDGEYYLLCMTDPDAPSRENPVRAQMRHWLVGNIPGDNIDEGETLTEYIGSAPGNGTGLHRYVFLVYRQPGIVHYNEIFTSNRSIFTRPNFSINDFSKKYNLGHPYAGNFYLAQYDDYTPIVRAQLGDVST
ncbi:protein D3-like [Periplaneta americana]|uniref:protein D3-like n=1 Tax=Periplaneta americana TaxID=6978 RepID=UPI0037E7CD7E